MPIVRADVPVGFSDPRKEAIRGAIKAAIVMALAPEESKYIYVGVCEVFAPVGDGAPSVTIDLRTGYETERKDLLATAISDAFAATAGIDPRDVYMLFRETDAANHYCGGMPLADRVPADG